MSIVVDSERDAPRGTTSTTSLRDGARAYLGEASRRAIRSPGAVTLARDLK